MSLTPRQREVLEIIRAHKREHGVTPTYEEIGDKLGGLSKTSVFEHVEALIRKGHLRRTEQNKSRNLAIVGEELIILEEAVEAVTDALENHQGDPTVAVAVVAALNDLKRY